MDEYMNRVVNIRKESKMYFVQNSCALSCILVKAADRGRDGEQPSDYYG